MNAGELRIKWSDTGKERVIRAGELARARKLDPKLQVLEAGKAQGPTGLSNEQAMRMLGYQQQGLEALHQGAKEVATDPGTAAMVATSLIPGGAPAAIAGRLVAGPAASAAVAAAKGQDPARAARSALLLGVPAEGLAVALPWLSRVLKLNERWLRPTAKAVEEAPQMPAMVAEARQVLRAPGAPVKEVGKMLRTEAGAVRAGLKANAAKTVPRDDLFKQADAAISELEQASPELARTARAWVGEHAAMLPDEVPLQRAHAWKKAMQKLGSAKFSEVSPGALTPQELAKMSAQDTRGAIEQVNPGYNAANERVQGLLYGRKAVQRAQAMGEKPKAFIDPLTRVLTGGAAVGALAHHPEGFAAPAVTMLLHQLDNPYIYNRAALTMTDPRVLSAIRTLPYAAETPLQNRFSGPGIP